MIAWANDRGIKVYDKTDNKPIGFINRSTKGSPDPERYKCCLCWENGDTLLVGWDDWVKIGKVRTVRSPQGHFIKEVHVISVFNTDFYICGIAPFKEHLVLLAFNEGDNDEDDGDSEDSVESDNNNGENEVKNDGVVQSGKSKPPELRIVSRRGQWIEKDALPIKGYKPNGGKHFQRNKMLSRPSSFVSGHLANEINEIGNNSLNWQSEQRRTDHDYNDGNKHFFSEHDGYHVTYQFQNGQGHYEVHNHNNHNNNNYPGNGQFNDGYDKYPGDGRHQRNNNYLYQTRFKPYSDHNININYGLNNDE